MFTPVHVWSSVVFIPKSYFGDFNLGLLKVNGDSLLVKLRLLEPLPLPSQR